MRWSFLFFLGWGAKLWLQNLSSKVLYYTRAYLNFGPGQFNLSEIKPPQESRVSPKHKPGIDSKERTLSWQHVTKAQRSRSVMSKAYSRHRLIN